MRPSSILAAAVPVIAALLIAAYTEPPIPPLPVRQLVGSIQYRPVPEFADGLLGLPHRTADTRPKRLGFLGKLPAPEEGPPAIASSEATAARPPRDAQPGTCDAYPVPRTYESMLSDVPHEKRSRWWRVHASLKTDTEGRIACIHFTQLTPDEKTNRKTMARILGWKCQPTVLNGKKVEVPVEVEVGFCYQGL